MISMPTASADHTTWADAEPCLAVDAALNFQSALKTGDAAKLSSALQELHHLPATLASLLKSPFGGNGVSALRSAMAAGHRESVELLISAVDALRIKHGIWIREEASLLIDAMRNDTLDHPCVFTPWLDALKRSVDAGRMCAADVRQALTATSTRFGASIRLWALDPGKGDRLRHWGALVAQAQARGLINAAEADRVLRGPDEVPLLRMLERSGNPGALAAYSDALAAAKN